ncbi:MAG: hypothetical protein NTW59_00035 [Candidatus Diapherotrites archaeon]|nr:hypothetical protein [Candidatus Diapherotrites archaeon]
MGLLSRLLPSLPQDEESRKRNKMRTITMIGVCIIIIAAALITLQFKETRVFVNNITKIVVPGWVPFPADDPNSSGNIPGDGNGFVGPNQQPQEPASGDEGGGGGGPSSSPPSNPSTPNPNPDTNPPTNPPANPPGGGDEPGGTSFDFPDGAVFPAEYFGVWEEYSIIGDGSARHITMHWREQPGRRA